MMRLSAAIMAHPDRRANAETVQAALDRPVEIVYDENPVPSADPRQRWRTAQRAWEHAADHDSDWAVVIQDDALVCADFLAGTENALDQVGTEGIVSLYTGTGRPDQHNVRRALANADKHGHAWMSTRSLNWGVAIALPTAVVPEMLQWCSRAARSRMNTDYRIGVWARDHKHWRTWYTVPSLVDHADIPSLIGHGGGRIAHRFLGTDMSALTVDWTRTPPGGLPAHHAR